MLIGLQNVTFEFGARVIVEDATWHIQPGERIGLIGQVSDQRLPDAGAWGGYPGGVVVTKGDPLFPRKQ